MDKVFKKETMTKFYLICATETIIGQKLTKVSTFTSEDFEGIEELYAMWSHFVIVDLGHANEYVSQVSAPVEHAFDSNGQILLPELPEANHTPGEDQFTPE